MKVRTAQGMKYVDEAPESVLGGPGLTRSHVMTMKRKTQ